MECTVMSMLKSTVKSTAKRFKPGILKNERNIDITFEFLALQEGPCIQGGGLGLVQLFNAASTSLSTILMSHQRSNHLLRSAIYSGDGI